MENSVKTEKTENRRGDSRGLHPSSLRNLRAGKGRPPNELSITNLQREMLSQPCPYAHDKTWAEWLARRGMELAGENATYYRELMDRLEGKVTQPISGEGGGPVVFKVIVADEHDRTNVERVMRGERTEIHQDIRAE